MKRLLSTLLMLLGIIVGANAQNDMTSTPLTFEAVEAGTITVNLDDGATLNAIQYNLNNNGWTDVTWNTAIELAANDVISFRGDNGTCYDDSNWKGFHFECSNDCYAYGNMMSLIDKDGFATNTELTETYAFYRLFQKSDYSANTTILNHPTYDIVLPATTLTINCYDGLFADCQGITRAPALPATELADWCYSDMFSGCTGLTAAPSLPATTMKDHCYNDMFAGCTTLTVAPALPATTLDEGCYAMMFWGCTYLEMAPALPATTLANECYVDMFHSCTTLSVAPALPATTLAEMCYANMFEGCTSLTTAPELPATSLVPGCYGMMFNNCSNLNYVKCLATDLGDDEDWSTFNWLSGVSSTGTFVKAAGADWSGQVFTEEPDEVSGIPEGWIVQDDTPYNSYTTPLTFESVQAGTITIENPNVLTIEYNKNGTGWTSANTDPISITVAAGDVVQFRGDNACYWATGDSGETVTRFTATNPVYVYGNVMSLIDKDDFATNTTLTEEFALAYLFAAPSSDIFQFYANNSTILNHPNKDLVLPATTVTGTCYGYMFAGCEGLTRAPELPATTLAMGCYHQMFADCSGLTEAPSLPATTLADMCYSSMFYNCTSLTTAPDLPATTLSNGCYMAMFSGCSNLNYVRCLATSVYEADCTTDWLNGVATVGTFIKAFDMWDWSTGVNGIPEGWTVEEDITTAPLTIEAIEDGTVVTITNTNSLYLRVSIQYGSSTSGFSTNQKTYTQTLPAGAALSIKLHGQTGTNTHSGNFKVTASKDVYVYGNPLSLVYTSFSNKKDLTGCAYGVLEGLFCLGYEGSELNPHIKNHPTKDIVLPATTLSNGCYMAMFSGCTGLTRAPELPATILSEDCYHRMFEYSGLTQAPVLPAATLIGQCYGGMFDHCSDLNYVRCMATDLGENNGEMACGDWLKDVAATGTFVKAPGMDSWTVGPQEPGGLIYGIPEGWITCDKVFQTAGNWNVAANWNTGAVPAAGSDVVIAANVIVPDEYVADAGNVFVEKGNTLTIADGGQLYHTNAGVMATVEKTITAYSTENGVNNGWNLIGYPFAENGAVDELTNLLANEYDLYYYDEPTHYWRNQEDAANNFTELEAAKGYLYANSATVALGLTGTLNQANATVSIPLSYTEDIDLAGFNLVGNPFAHNVTSFTGTNVAAEVYRMNDTKDNLMVSEVSATNPLLPGEGFFVKATDDDASITFNSRATYTQHGSIALEISENGLLVDRFILKNEGEPLEKFSLNERSTRIYATKNAQNWAVVPMEGNEQAVSFKATKNGTYMLNVNIEDMELDYFHLIDNLTGTDVDLLAEPIYTFTAKTTDYASRFRLVFSASEASLGSASDENFAFINDGDIIITGDIENATLQVIDVTGRIVQTVGLSHHGSRITTVGMTPGVYVLRLINGDDVKTQKMVID